MVFVSNSLAIAFFYCVFRVTAVDGHYQIGIYSVREIQHGEEITFDYNSVTEVCPVACQPFQVCLLSICVISTCSSRCRARRNMKLQFVCVEAKFAVGAI